MKIAFSTISCPTHGPEQIAGFVRDYGYDGVELYALEGERLYPALIRARLSELRAAFHDIPIVCINSWARLSSPSSDERAAQAHQILQSFELAVELACPLVKTFGGELPVDLPHNEVFDYMAATLWPLAQRAEELGVTLVLETHDGFARGAFVAELLTRVKHPGFAALWDVHHPYRMHEPPSTTDALIGPRVRHVHVKDAVPTENGWRFVLLGEGELPVAQVLASLANRGYQGAIAVDWEKMWRPEIADPEIALPHYAGALRALIKQAQLSARQGEDLSTTS